MRHVADLAGVGLGTVSRVVNNESHVAPATAARVRAAIEELGFQRDEVGRTLRPGQRSSSVAILLGNLTNPFYASIAHGTLQVAQREYFSVVVGTVDEDPAAERRVINELIRRRIAGLIIVPDQADYSFLSDDLPARTPVIFADRPGEGIAADSVLNRQRGGGYAATRHLISHQHDRIAVLVAPAYYTTGYRLRGYRRALREAGIEPDAALIRRLRRGSVEAAADATAALLAMHDPPTAIFATTNLLSEGATRSIRHHNRRVALVGFDDFRFADMLPDPVTVAAADPVTIGTTAMELLLDRIRGSTAPHQRIVLPATLIERGSGETPGFAQTARPPGPSTRTRPPSRVSG